MPFSGPKWPICAEQNYFGTNNYYYFHLPIDPFHWAKSKKNLTSDPWVMRMHHFGPKWPICPNFFFFLKNYYHSHLPISPFHRTKLKKNYSSGSRVMRMHHFWAQNGPFVQMRIFSENLLMSRFFHSCLSTCQKSKSDNNHLVKFWQLKNTEISLAKRHFLLTWELDFSQASSFYRMLMNHKNFHFEQISDKTNDRFS